MAIRTPQGNTAIPKTAQQFIDSRLMLKAMNQKETGCTYYDKFNSKKPCKMTSQKTCEECRFFMPNFAERAEAVAEHLHKMDTKQSELTEALKAARRRAELQDREIFRLKEVVKAYKTVVELIKENLEDEADGSSKEV